MKTILAILLMHILSISSCNGKNTEVSQNDIDPENNSVRNILIVYVSRTNNTKAVAEIIQNQVGGTLVELELEIPYPLDYKEIVEQVNRENEEGFHPVLKTKIDDIDKYDIVFLGFPTWDMQMPPPMKSFLTRYELDGKTIIPFNTNAGYGVGSGFEMVKRLCPRSRVLTGFSTIGGVERDGILFVMKGEKSRKVKEEVRKWLERINIIQSDKN